MEYRIDHLPSEDEVLTADLQWFTFYNFYSQRNADGTVESWTEAVARATDNLRMLSDNKLNDDDYQTIFEGIYRQDVLPSMRLFSMPTKAIERDNTVIYNCCFVAPSDFNSIAEIFYLSMSGVGIGYSVESKVVQDLPLIPYFYTGGTKTHVVEDSQAGWANSVKFLFNTVLNCQIPVFDYSNVRPAGSPLVTKGGVASGPEPLKLYHEHVLNILNNKRGQHLDPIDVHDIINMISECSTSNGSRSGAMICLFDDNDRQMLAAKSDPKWYEKTPWRGYSNNSVVVNGSTENFIDQIVDTMIYDGTGEPGLFSREKFYNDPKRIYNDDAVIGVNPCGEVLLVSEKLNDKAAGQFCNLSTVVLNGEMSTDEFNRRLHVATMIGTIQSMATDFAYLNDGWREITERERLLGVCVTGIHDYHEQFDAERLQTMRRTVSLVNKLYAEILGIESSTSYTSVKPSGNSSCLTNTAPGVNPDFGEYQIRNIRVGYETPMGNFLREKNYPHFFDPFTTGDKMIVHFPKVSNSSSTLENVSAETQIAVSQLWAEHYTTHNVSVTITYDPNTEKDFIANWIKENYEKLTGMAFWPQYDQNQPYLPVEVVTEGEAEALTISIPTMNWDEYREYANGTHQLKRVLECSGDRCDVVFG